MKSGEIVTWRNYKSKFRIVRLLAMSNHAEVELVKSPRHKLIKPLSELKKVNNHV